MISESLSPRSMFQSTTRIELRGHESHWLGAKSSAMISLIAISNHGRCQLGKDVLLRKDQVNRIINLGPS